jgi:signal transduction histidine kinase
MISQVLEDVREITHDLRPYHLDRLGLKAALEFMIEKIASSSEIRFSSEFATIDGLLSKEAEMHLYRIVQESINNIIKHSKATVVRVALQRNDRQVQLSIEDNGKSLSANQSVATGSSRQGFGLRSISERVRILGGEQLIHSIPGEGTTITVTIMLSNRDSRYGRL